MKSLIINVEDNEPHQGNLISYTMYKHRLKNKFDHTLIEIRNDLLSSISKLKNISYCYM